MKNLLIILAVLVATFIYPSVTLWLVPFLISIITLIRFGTDETAKYVGLLSLKPTLMFVLFWLAANLNFLERLYSTFSYDIGSAIFAIIPELIMTFFIVCAFRNLLRSDKLAWLFLLGDMIRWLSLFVVALIPDPVPEPYFYTQFYIWVFFELIFPSLYSIVGLLSVRELIRSRDKVNQTELASPA